MTRASNEVGAIKQRSIMTGLYYPMEELGEHQQQGISASVLTVDVLPVLVGVIIYPLAVWN